jgi:hypothetical protein
MYDRVAAAALTSAATAITTIRDTQPPEGGLDRVA